MSTVGERGREKNKGRQRTKLQTSSHCSHFKMTRSGNPKEENGERGTNPENGARTELRSTVTPCVA